MNAACKADIDRLKQLAFRRVDACGGVFKRLHRLPRSAKSHEGFSALCKIREWMLAPFTLWPVDFVGLANHILNLIESKQPLDNHVALLTQLIAECPCESESKIIGEYEHNVQAGNYNSLITAQPKFEIKEQVLLENSQFLEDWKRLKANFDLDKYRDRKGIIRRRMALERSFRPDGWNFSWDKPEDRFLAIFDTFCHKWILYGMEGEKPLLQKLSVNLTPFGTMIFIPRYWSFDPNRDLRWRAITRLHRSREVRRQGAKLGQNQQQRKSEALHVQRLWREASDAGLRGDKRYHWVISKMKWLATTDFSKVKRLRRLKLVGQQI